MDYDDYTAADGPWTTIDGWNQQGVFTALKNIHKIQRKEEVFGNIGEIGVHDGQMLFALMLLANAVDTPKERALAIDVFDKQERNIDNSGGASIQKFYENLEDILPHDVRKTLRIIKDDSLLINPNHLLTFVSSAYLASDGILEASKFDSEYTNMFRLFSIDGGHTVVHVLNDLRLVERVMVTGGVVIVDDFMHPKWPGVTEGLHIYCSDSSSLLVPFAYGNNKMYLTTFDCAKHYSKQMMRNLTDVKNYKEVELWKRNLLWMDFE